MNNEFTGIVIRRINYGESNKIITILSESDTKLSLIARNAKNFKSRFKAGTEPFTICRFIYFQGNGMLVLTELDVINHNRKIREDILFASYSLYWLEFIDKIISDNEKFKGIYKLLLSSMELLVSKTDPDILSRIIELYILDKAGYRPITKSCCICYSIKDLAAFSVKSGGVICNKCIHREASVFNLDVPTIDTLTKLQNLNIALSADTKINKNVKENLEYILNEFINEYLPIRLNSKEVLKQIRRNLGMIN